MGLKKILVAIDHSPHAPVVFERAMAIAQQQGGELMILHVITGESEPVPFIGTLADMDLYGSLQRLQRGQLRQQIQGVRDWLETYAEQAIARKLPTEFTCKLGSPGREICHQAQQWRADLIIVGRRGRSGVIEALLGSVSNDVIHHAPCSVLVVQGVIPVA